jgi:ABC-type uncharacterized transport system YnjBCD permease subunit
LHFELFAFAFKKLNFYNKDMDLNILNAIAAIVLLGITIAFIIVSWILNYHWERYEISISRTFSIRKIYFTISGIMLFIILLLFFNLKQ